MNRLFRWGLGTAVVMTLAMSACGRTEKTPKPEAASKDSVPSPPPGEKGSGVPIPNPAAGMPVAGAERAFVAEAAASGLAEIEAGHFVAGKTADPALKAYAEQLAREHASANDELKRIAGNKHLTVPEAADGEAKARLDRLTGLPATEVDRSFIQDFGIAAHTRSIELFERQAREGQDPELRAFAEQTLPKLREHLAMARQLLAGG